MGTLNLSKWKVTSNNIDLSGDWSITSGTVYYYGYLSSAFLMSTGDGDSETGLFVQLVRKLKPNFLHQ